MPTKPLRAADPTVKINFTLPASEAERIRQQAREQDETVSRMLRRLAREDRERRKPRRKAD